MSVAKPTTVPRWADGGTNTPTNVVQPPESNGAIVAWAPGPFTVAAFRSSGGNYYIVTSISGTGTSTTGPAGTGQTIDNPGANQVVWQWVTANPVTKDSGWLPNGQPPAQVFNWLFYWIYQWLLWVQDLANQNFTATGSNPVGPWTGLHQFSNTVKFTGGVGSSIQAFPASGNTDGLVAVAAGFGTGVDASGGASGSSGVIARGTSSASACVGIANTTTGNGATCGQNSGSGPGVQGINTGTGYGCEGLGGAGAAGVHGTGGTSSDPGVLGDSTGGGPGVQGNNTGFGPAVLGINSGGTSGGSGGSFQNGANALPAVLGHNTGAGPGGIFSSVSGFAAIFGGLGQFASSTIANPAKTLDCGTNGYGAPHVTKAWATVEYNAGVITWDGVGISSITAITSPTTGLLVTLSHPIPSGKYGVMFGGEAQYSTGAGTNDIEKPTVERGSKTSTTFIITLLDIKPGAGMISVLDPAIAIGWLDFEVKGRHV